MTKLKVSLASIVIVTALVLQLSTLTKCEVSNLNEFNYVNYHLIPSEPTYFALASKTIRPGQVYRISVTIYRTNHPLTVRASIHRNGVELTSSSQECKPYIPEILLLKVPSTSQDGNYKLSLEGNLNGVLGGSAFFNETNLNFSQRSMTIFITTDKPIYQQGQVVKFRALPITTDLKAFSDAIDVVMIDPRGNIMKRWLSRQSNLGAVSLEYTLSTLPVFGNWTIQVIAQGQMEKKHFIVEEYYQTRFEVNVSMPSFFLDTDKYIFGSVMANYTSGIPVTGNLTILATIEPSRPVGSALNRPPAIEHSTKMFSGYTEFRFETSALAKLIGDVSLHGSKVSVTAYVGDRFNNIIYSGFARAYIFGSRIKLRFLGSSPQVFKASMPFKAFCAVSYHDGSPLSLKRLRENDKIEIRSRVRLNSGSFKALETRLETMSPINPGIWEVNVDLKEELNSNKRLLDEIKSLHMEAVYTDKSKGESAKTVLDVYSSYSPSQRLIQVSTSTNQPRVGEYIIFHIRANYFVELFSYAIISKGMILQTSREEMTSMIKTFAVTLSPEMAPSSTIVIYDLARGGEVIVDALTFPVDGISRNNFSVTLNPQKDKTGDTIEVVVLGQPGTYVGLSGLDKDLFAVDVGNQINHADVLKKMSTFDDNSNGTLTYTWVSREGRTDRFLHFPSPTFGIDANRTFEYAGLVVFTDANITRRREICNNTIGYFSCLDGSQCFHASKRCDKRSECTDGTDESNCPNEDPFNLAQFRVYRTNRLQRLYDNSWLWKDINIGPLGYYIFSVPVPSTPTSWVISAFGMSSSYGFGLQHGKIAFSSVRPFFMNVEMPNMCIFGEQIGIRVSVFNYRPYEIEVTVVLGRSPYYKFVHVEPYGQVASYNPRTSSGEHHHLILIRPGQTSEVYMPIVATVLGKVNVTIACQTQVAKESVTRTLIVEPDGIPQITHTSVILDLSQGAYLIKYLDTNITESPEVLYREERRYIYGSNKARVTVVGDVVGPAFPYMPVNSSNLLQKPSSCGEQNMFNFAMNMYTLLYLRLTGQRNPEVEKQAFKYLNIQYQRQLSFQNPDGSFHVFRWNHKPSVWLTAFCVRIFHKATFQEWEHFLYIDPKITNNAVEWILRHQNREGSFYETSPFTYDRKMNLTSKAEGDNRLRNISLTAHVLIALVEVRDLSGEIGAKASTARTLAQRYLERMLHVVKTFEDPYELAIVTYALTMASSVEAEEAFNFLDEKMRVVSGMRYWGKEALVPPKPHVENNRPYLLPRLLNKYDALNIETTAYGLLVHIAKQAVIQKEIVEWLNGQRFHVGGWASTQDSVIAYQALIEYSVQSRLRDVTDIDIVIEAPSSPELEKKVHIGQKNLATLQTFDVANAYGPIVIKAQGSGLAIVQLEVQYNVDYPNLQIPPPVNSFDLRVVMHASGRNSSHLTYKSCQRWTHTRESLRSGMAVLDVTVPTGYVVQQQVLDAYVRTRSVRNLQEARFTERKVTFYFDFLDAHDTCVSFTVQRWYPVANMTRFIPVRVYDYYAPERFNETMINTYNLYALSICHVCGSYQCPFCPIFSGSKWIQCNYITITLICFIGLFYTQFK